MKHLVENIVRDAVKVLVGEGVELEIAVTYPKVQFGDYASNVALVLAKKVPSLAIGGPQELAEKIVELIKSSDKDNNFSEVNAVSGFINFTLSKQVLLRCVKQILDKRDEFGKSDFGENKTVVVEYFQNNVAKPPHVAHIRSAVIGDCLHRLYETLGYKVISDTHIGDWGTQFGILIHAYKTFGNKEFIEKDPINNLNELYIRMNKLVKEDPTQYEKSKQEFKKLEDGDAENRELWQWFVSESVRDFNRYCELLELMPFDYNLGESFYEDKMPMVLEDFEKKGLVKSGETGERYVDLEEYGLGRCILIKSDGATTYHMRDFATYIYRKTEWDFYKNLYVVDNRQSHHFKQLFKVLELAGYPAETDSKLVDFGLMSLPTGAISTREGNVISLENLVQEAERKSLEIINTKNPNLVDKEKVSAKVARASIKYFDLSHNRKSDYVFTWEKAISFEGNTGPYLQYTHARIHGILAKSAQELRESSEINTDEFNDDEMLVMRKLTQYSEVLQLSAEQQLPSLICTYLFELASIFNSFYEAVPVNSESNILKKNFRLSLSRSTAQIIKNGLNILGVEALEEM